MTADAERHLRALELPVVEAAELLVGCTITHGETAGVIVETEAYHEVEPACHAFAGLTPRTWPLFEAPGIFYVYRSYGVHALLNVVVEPAGVGAAVLIRALEPLAGEELMRARRGRDRGAGPVLRAGQAHAGARHRPRPQRDERCCDGPIGLGPPPADRAAAAPRARPADRDHAGDRAAVALLRGG